jgi:glyoxylase-like metal-dependent hydrolase (beta-lactamase superfamily II)
MRRTLVLGALLVAGLLSVAVAAQQTPPPPTANDVMVEKVRDNFYVLRGGFGGNTAAFITANGVVLVDTKMPGWGQPLLDTLKRLTPKPVTTVINTHWHFDHVSGNVEMPANVEFVTHENTKTSMEQQNPVYQNYFKQHNGHGMPTKTFRDTMTLGSGSDRIELRYFGRAHTGGDAFVIFPALRIAHVGDVFPNKGLPNIDKDNGGSGVAYADTIDKAAKGLADMTALINGHADAQTTVADLREYGAFICDFTTAVRAAKKSGKTVDQFVKEWKTPAKYKGYAAADAPTGVPNITQAEFARNAATAIWEEIK